MLKGSNTWDAYSVSSIVHAETGLRPRFGVMDKESGERRMEFLLPDITPGPGLIGPRTADGSYIEWRVEQEGFRVLLEFSARGDDFVWRIAR